MSRFQDQLDEYEAERNALLSQNSQAKDEVKLWSFTLLKENIHIFMRFTFVQSKKVTKTKQNDCGSFWLLGIGCPLFFSTKAQRCIDRGRHHHFGLAPTLCQFQPPGGFPYKRGGMLVVSVIRVNFRFWSHFGCSGENDILFSRKGLFWG